MTPTSIRIPEDLKKRIKLKAKQEGRMLSQQIVYTLSIHYPEIKKTK